MSNKKRKGLIATGLISFVIASIGMKALDSETPKKVITFTKEKDTNNVLNKKLEEYANKRDALEREIAALEQKKERLKTEENFALKDLVVMEDTNIDNDTSLYILKEGVTSGIYEEYHHNFHAWYRMHEEGKHSEICGTYIHFDECYPLFNYLTDEEKQEASDMNGIITTSELDEISERINEEYKEKAKDKEKVLVKVF